MAFLAIPFVVEGLIIGGVAAAAGTGVGTAMYLKKKGQKELKHYKTLLCPNGVDCPHNPCWFCHS